MSARRGRARVLRTSALTLSLLGATALGGCATMSGNVKGSFSCQAPDGICAPTSAIDDRALAMITGEPMGPGVSPAGPYVSPATAPRARVARASVPAQLRTGVVADAGRTREKVLRIVFQPYIDDRGRLHEASAVHAVVAGSDWEQQVLAGAAAIPPAKAVGSVDRAESFAELVDRADVQSVASMDSNLPDPAAVAAARARAADPIAEIKSNVAARLAPKAGRTSPRVPVPVPAAPAGAGTKPVIGSASPGAVSGAGKGIVSATSSSGAAAKPALVQAGDRSGTPSVTASAAAEAMARVKGDPQNAAAVQKAQDGARQAAAQNGTSEIKPVLKTTVTAAGFPGSIQEDR